MRPNSESGVSPPIARATERLFARLSAARRRRIFHPQGLVFGGTLTVEASVPGAPILERGATHDVVVRFSRALGTPRGRLDFLGLAIRIADRQDLLLASSAAAPAVRYMPLPARTFAGTTFTTLLPFSVGGRHVLVGARVHHARAAADDQLAALAAAAARAPLSVTVAVAEPAHRWRRVARIDVARGPTGAVIAFDPWNCGGGIVPAGPVNALRAPAYRGSRRGRSARR